MGRSGYCDDGEDWSWALSMGWLKSAINGKRGQEFLKELQAALEAMPVKRLITGALEANGEMCALGVVGKARGMDMKDIDPYEAEQVAHRFKISNMLAREIAYQNDDKDWDLYYDTHKHLTPEQRWSRVHEWVTSQIKP